ncbi:MAG: excinuclease ABC subunit UvrC [Candidatus Woesearchaeota archaeon]
MHKLCTNAGLYKYRLIGWQIEVGHVVISYQHLPSAPGCYLFKDSEGKVLYVGKAANLKKRVSQYALTKQLDPKTKALLSHVTSVDVIVTNTEVEAFLLENTLIKKYQPHYNINLKDAKRYAYLAITNEPFPRLITVRKREGEVYGPFVSGTERDDLQQLLVKLFKLRTCNTLPKRACLRYHLGICSAPCIGAVDPHEYAQSVDHARQVLKGKSTTLLAVLEQKMTEASAAQAYEQALQYRNQIQALQALLQRQAVERSPVHNEHVLHYLLEHDQVHVLVFVVEKGMLGQKQEFCFAYHEDWFEEFLVQYYSQEPLPQELILPQSVSPAMQDYLNQKAGRQVRITIPQKGEKKQLLDLALLNLQSSVYGAEQKVMALQKALGMQSLPAVIECIDISHLSGSSTVASLVQFVNGKPNKSGYRRFAIKTVEGINDVASIAEVVKRRYGRLAAEGLAMPDLVVIDGGKGQLRAAYDTLRMLGIMIPVISLAKQFEEIYVPGKPLPIRLDKKSMALQLLQEIRDEAHRFALTYHRLLRKKKQFDL